MNIRRTLCQVGVVLLSFASYSGYAQANPGSPVDHMTQLNEMELALQKKYLSYMSVVAHGNSARRQERKREDLIKSIQESIQQVGRIKPYKGDASLRNTYSDYLKLLLTVFKEDYHKIVDMEAIAEQSYDNMEAYLLAQEKASEKLGDAAEKIGPSYKEFAARHNVILTESDKESKLTKKLRLAGEVSVYYHKIYLVFFKSSHQEGYLIKAIESYDVNAIEQSRNTLSKYSIEGLNSLDSIKSFKGDASLVGSTRKVLEFYKQEAESIPAVTDFLLKKDEFEKIKKAFDAKPQSKRTQQDIDNYNKSLTEVNNGINKFNKMMQDYNKNRSKQIENWNAASKHFMDSHIPNA